MALIISSSRTDAFALVRLQGLGGLVVGGVPGLILSREMHTAAPRDG